MRKAISIILVSVFALSYPVYGEENEMGHNGGISEGSTLPKTIEKYVTMPTETTNTYQYKEVVFLSGKAMLLEGTIEITVNDELIETNPTGSYGETYKVVATNKEENAILTREIDFVTYYRVKDGNFKRVVDTESSLSKWSETLSLDGETYTLVEDQSSFFKSGIKDRTPGVDYYDTDVSYVAKYAVGESDFVTVTSEGSNYGFDQPWSKVETQDREISIEYTDETKEPMSVTTQATLESKKTIYYDETEPYQISFEGTYNQRMEREATLSYKINSYHKNLTKNDYNNSYTIKTANQIEKLPIPENLDFLKGHWAEDDFKKLYSMEIFSEIPHSGMQYEAISRGEYIKALCLAMNIETQPYEEGDETQFGDVSTDHPMYPYVMAAFDNKLIKGTGENFDVDRPITREEAFVIYIRVIGLERLGVTDAPQTPFVDDADIADWAKKEIMAGYRLGIIQGDSTGHAYPKQWISKAEAAAIINRLINYLREDIAIDYRK